MATVPTKGLIMDSNNRLTITGTGNKLLPAEKAKTGYAMNLHLSSPSE